MNILNEDLDLRERIRLYIEQKGFKLTVLAKECGRSIGHLRGILHKERNLTDEILAKLNNHMGTDFKKDGAAKVNGQLPTAGEATQLNRAS